MNFIQRISKLLVFSIILSIGYSQSGRDLTGTTVTAEAYRAEGDSHTTVEFIVNVVSPDLNFADGVRFTFAESVNVLDAFVETEMETDPAIVIAGHEVLFGDSSDGVFNGDGIFTNDNEYRFIVHIGAAGHPPLRRTVAPVSVEPKLLATRLLVCRRPVALVRRTADRSAAIRRSATAAR